MNYKVVKRPQPGVAGGGDFKYYASALYSGKIDLPGLAEKLADGSTLRKLDTMAVLIGLVDLMTQELKEGKKVELGELGTFRVIINSKGEESVEQVSANSIKAALPRFTPGKKFKNGFTNFDIRKGQDVSINPVEDESGETTEPTA